MNNRDWVLLVVSAGDSPLSPIQLQKSLFLLSKKIGDTVGESFYSFTPYNYGPFCPAIYRDAEELQSLGLVHVHQNGYKSYSVSPAGRETAGKIIERLPEEVAFFVFELVEWVKGLSFKQLCKAIYSEYPEYTENSVFRF